MYKLNIGDKIGVISTARKINISELKPAINMLNDWGLEVVLGQNLFMQDNQFSGTVEQRVFDIQSMIDNNEIHAIICARGGYGTVQIIDKIDFSSFIKNPKWIVGYSDVTVLHSHLNNLKIPSLHATMPINFKNNTKASLDSLRKGLFGLSIKTKSPPNKLNSYGEVTAEVVGGNLSILYSLLGSSSAINTNGKILFIEDLDEYLYHLDRMIISLKRNNLLKNIRGIVVGGMRKIHDNIVPFGKSAEEIIAAHIKEYNIPACYSFPAGHINDNRCIILGREARLVVNKNGAVLYQE